MENQNEKNIITKLYEQAEQLGAGEAHIDFNGVGGHENVTGVFSVFIGSRPSHKVLDELYDWAEENKFQVVMDKIQELSEWVQEEEEA